MLTLVAAAVLAFPTTLVGAHAGAATAPVQGASIGPGAGIEADLSLQKQFAVGVSIDVSRHALGRGAGLLTSAGAGLQYRLDLTPVIPYLAASIRYLDFAAKDFVTTDFEGALSLGAIVPFGERWFVGIDVTYGYGLVSGAFPLSTAFTARIGWRSGDLN